uniref:Laccase-25 n=1 Tax=Cacopsylla melanoneura TaxID=428564 RepID=A0A8D8T1Y9_9HEMI
MAVYRQSFHQCLFLWIFRCTLFVGVISVVLSIVYYTPFPDMNTFPDCNRPCHELDWPMICRFKLHVQYSESLTLCQNHTFCTNEDGFTKSCSTQSCEHVENVHLINGKLLGPTIQVCKNDILVIDIINHLPARSIAFHWHGQLVRETPSMDGIAMVTQCPVLSHTVYQYKLRAAQAGTHYYHALTGDSILDQSLQGGLIVRESDREEVHSKLYNEDRVSHTVHLTQHKDLLFVNGRSLQTGFLVSSNTKYRFRLIHGATCPLVLSIASHPLLVIALDGAQVQPQLTEAIELAPGERLDFVVNADKPIGSYEVHIRSTNPADCSVTLGGKVNLAYNSSHSVASSKLESGKIRSKVNEDREKKQKYGKVELVTTIQSPSLSKVITLEKLQPASRQIEQEETQPSSVLEVTLEYYKTDFNNVSFLFPPSPLVSQLDEVDPLSLCSSTDGLNLPHPPCTQEHLCHCTHLIRVPLHTVVQVTLVDKGKVPTVHTCSPLLRIVQWYK